MHPKASVEQLQVFSVVVFGFFMSSNWFRLSGFGRFVLTNIDLMNRSCACRSLLVKGNVVAPNKLISNFGSQCQTPFRLPGAWCLCLSENKKGRGSVAHRIVLFWETGAFPRTPRRIFAGLAT